MNTVAVTPRITPRSLCRKPGRGGDTHVSFMQATVKPRAAAVKDKGQAIKAVRV